MVSIKVYVWNNSINAICLVLLGWLVLELIVVWLLHFMPYLLFRCRCLVVIWYNEVGTTLVKILWEVIFKHWLLYISVSLIAFACMVWTLKWIAIWRSLRTLFSCVRFSTELIPLDLFLSGHIVSFNLRLDVSSSYEFFH